MRKLVVLLTALVLGLLGAACSSDVGSCVAPDAAPDTSVASVLDAPAASSDSASPTVDASQAADAAGLADGGAEMDGGQGDDATPAEADSGSD